MLNRIKNIIGEIKFKKLNNQLNKELEKANKLYKEKSDTVVCKYCGKLLKKQESGQYYDIPNQELVFFHEECFNENEKIGTLEDLEESERKVNE